MTAANRVEKSELKVVDNVDDYANDDVEDRVSTIASGSIDDASPLNADDGSPGGFSISNINPRIIDLEYAVRGLVLDRALEIAKDFSGHPFTKLLKCHIGNPHAVGMPSVTYIREILSLITCPLLEEVDESILGQFYAKDSIERARRYRKYLGDPGSYTHSKGAAGFREEIADWLEERDDVRPDIDDLFLTNGASDGIESVLQCLLHSEKDAVLIPLPQYPLYTATITKIGGTAVFYELNEKDSWSLDLGVVKRAYLKAVEEDGLNVKAMAVICPGNPAPTLLSRDQKVEILKFCQEQGLLLLADEVYQENLYYVDADGGPSRSDVSTSDEPCPFVSFRRALLESGLEAQLVSFHSSSKGLVGECGFRGGLMAVDNISKESNAILYKLRSVCLCPNTLGQAVMTLVTTPPKKGSPSYLKYVAERDAVYAELKAKADLVYRFFNSLAGTSCQRISGGMYAFPRFEFTEHAIKTAQNMGMSVNLFYCMELLEATGIVTVPGCGFGEAKNSYHMRMTILPSLEELKEALETYREFHKRFWQLYCL